MKVEKLSQKALERKSNKPIMEKKRRARINHCLNQLKALILEADNEQSRHSKLEKADILEMTVKYLQSLRTYHLNLLQYYYTSNQPAANQLQQLASSPTLPALPGSPPSAAALTAMADMNNNYNKYYNYYQQYVKQQ